MPSLVATMRPTSVETRLASKSLSRCLMTSEISLGSIGTRLLLRSFRQSAAQLLQSGGDTRVDEVVAILELQPTQDCGIDLEPEADLLAQALRKLVRDAVTIMRCELDRGCDGGAAAAGGRVSECFVLVDKGADLPDAVRFNQELRQVDGLLVESGGRDGDQLHPRAERDGRIGHNRCHGLLEKDLAKDGQALAPFLYPPFFLSQVEHRPRVPPSGCRCHSPPPQSPCR